MKKNKIRMFIWAAVSAAALSMSACGGSENKEKDASATEMTEAQVAVNTTDKYVCPMNCEGSGSNQPGKCPVCGMDLVENPNYTGTEVAATDTTSAPAAAASEEKQQ
ncbi:MAG TPA: heavy metal-binding domain-containing protein [Bacteroidia bacterium]|nr:heavy metal-binding domain-containing protein [Bacteroidia bacterium]